MQREDARQIAETMLRTCGRAVVVRVRQATAMPPMEVTLKPCLLKVSGEVAELLVADNPPLTCRELRRTK